MHQESYPNDALLIGHFDVCGCLIAFLSSEHKEAIGSAANGKQFVRVFPFNPFFCFIWKCIVAGDRSAPKNASFIADGGLYINKVTRVQCVGFCYSKLECFSDYGKEYSATFMLKALTFEPLL